jgi:hypothetical protein
MKRKKIPDIERVIRDGAAIDQAIVAARRRVIQRHRQTRVPLVIWREGRVIEVPPESVELPGESRGLAQQG